MVNVRASPRAGKRKSLWHRYLKIFIVLLILILGVSTAFRIGKTLQNSLFDGVHRFTVVIKSKDVALLTLEPKTKQAALIITVSNIRVPVPGGGEGDYELGKVYPLGAFDKRGGILLKDTLQFLVGAPVDGWIVIKNLDDSCANLYRSFTIACFEFLIRTNLSGQLDTNLTPFDMTRIIFALSTLRDKTEYRTLALLDVVKSQERILADGTKAVYIKESSQDAVSRELFQDTELIAERMSVSVVNGTDIAGFGNTIARTLSNSGMNVVSVTTTLGKRNAQSSITVAKDKRNTYTLDRVKRIFGFPVLVEELMKEDIRIDVGKDPWK